MSSRSRFSLIKRIGVDFILWTLIPSVFLWAYLRLSTASLSVVQPHLRLAWLLFFGLTTLRLALAASFADPRIGRGLFSMVHGFVFLTMLIYYTLVLVGLQTWGQVISADLIASYFTQLPELADTLGIPLLPVAVGIVVVYSSFALLVWMYFNRYDWALGFVQSLKRWHLAGLFGFAAAFCGLEAFAFFNSPATSVAEPLSLTLFPRQGAAVFQNHAIDRLSAEKLDRADDNERATYKPAAGFKARNLILIVVDALRPDHMGIYGYARDTTPHLREIGARQALRIGTGIRASCAESSCGLLSLASSKYVHQFSNRPFTLQQALKMHGYRVHMILGGDHTNFYGLKKLYGEVDSYHDGSQAKNYAINDDSHVIEHTRALPSWDGRPVMLQFHLMSAHVLGKRHAEFSKFQPASSYALNRSVSEKNIQQAINYYDNGVLQSDEVIANMLAVLQEKKYLEDSLVVVTADHGDALGEHGLFSHANSVHEAGIRIPFLLLSYGYSPNSLMLSRNASQVDIAPTILEEFGMRQPSTWSGSPLQNKPQSEFTYFQEGNEVGVIDHRQQTEIWKYSVDSKTGKQVAFNLTTDPEEKNNGIALVAPSTLREWRRQVLNLLGP